MLTPISKAYMLGAMPLSDKIRAAREAAGLKQKDIANHFGIKPESVSQWEAAGGTGPSRKRLTALAKLLNKPLAYFVDDDPVNGAPANDLVTSEAQPKGDWQNEVALQEASELPIIAGLPRDLPVRGSAQAGGGVGDFQINGEVVDWIRRPPALMGVKEAFAVAVIGSSMSPRFEDGEVVFVHPGRRYARGQDVIIELYSEDPGEPVGPALVKRFIAESTDRVMVEQFNPRKKFNIPKARIKRIGLILVGAELFRQ